MKLPQEIQELDTNGQGLYIDILKDPNNTGLRNIFDDYLQDHDIYKTIYEGFEQRMFGKNYLETFLFLADTLVVSELYHFVFHIDSLARYPICKFDCRSAARKYTSIIMGFIGEDIYILRCPKEFDPSEQPNFISSLDVEKYLEAICQIHLNRAKEKFIKEYEDNKRLATI